MPDKSIKVIGANKYYSEDIKILCDRVYRTVAGKLTVVYTGMFSVYSKKYLFHIILLSRKNCFFDIMIKIV